MYVIYIVYLYTFYSRWLQAYMYCRWCCIRFTVNLSSRPSRRTHTLL